MEARLVPLRSAAQTSKRLSTEAACAGAASIKAISAPAVPKRPDRIMVLAW